MALPRLAAALALYALATVLRGERWLRLLRYAGAYLSRTDAYAVTVVGYMGNNALPARAGDVLKSVLSSRKAGTPTADGFGSLVAERVLDAVALVLVFAVLVTTLHLPLGVEGWMLAAVGARARPSRRRPPPSSGATPARGAGCRSWRRACWPRPGGCGRRRAPACSRSRSSCG